ncbi:hypothetical protein, partial [Aeromonas dhakensis]|uniref:hypothetical protein n=1 Tax=Aeromonas dhakensis TaxID=196024 RepID=UPI003985B310
MALPLRSKQKGNSTGNCAEMAEFQVIKKPAQMSGLLKLGAWQCPTLAWRMPHYHRRYSVSLL